MWVGLAYCDTSLVHTKFIVVFVSEKIFEFLGQIRKTDHSVLSSVRYGNTNGITTRVCVWGGGGGSGIFLFFIHTHFWWAGKKRLGLLMHIQEEVYCIYFGIRTFTTRIFTTRDIYHPGHLPSGRKMFSSKKYYTLTIWTSQWDSHLSDTFYICRRPSHLRY